MIPLSGRDLMAELANAVAAYLSTMEVTADCLEESYPEVGTPYRKRIQALQSRVSYDATPKEIKDSAQAIQAELRDYASVAKRVRTERSVELEREVLALGDIIENLAERQAYFGRRLRDLHWRTKRRVSRSMFSWALLSTAAAPCSRTAWRS